MKKIRRRHQGYDKLPKPIPITGEGKKTVVAFQVGRCLWCGNDLRVPTNLVHPVNKVDRAMRAHVKQCRMGAKRRVAHAKYIKKHFGGTGVGAGKVKVEFTPSPLRQDAQDAEVEGRPDQSQAGSVKPRKVRKLDEASNPAKPRRGVAPRKGVG